MSQQNIEALLGEPMWSDNIRKGVIVGNPEMHKVSHQLRKFSGERALLCFTQNGKGFHAYMYSGEKEIPDGFQEQKSFRVPTWFDGSPNMYKINMGAIVIESYPAMMEIYIGHNGRERTYHATILTQEPSRSR